MGGVLVVGAAAMDLSLQVEAFAQADELVFPNQVERLPGGSAANVACQLGVFGVPTAFAGMGGEDEQGRALRAAFLADGVDPRYFFQDPKLLTAATLVVRNRKGERLMYSLGGAPLLPSAASLPDAAFLGIRALYLAEAHPQVAEDCIRRAKEQGAKVYFAPGAFHCAGGYGGLPAFAKGAEVWFLSEAELNLLSLGSREQALEVLKKIVPELYLTLGSEGALYCCRGKQVEAPAYRVRCADATGAGDAFAAAVIAGERMGYCGEERLRFANAAAACSLGTIGGRAHITLEQARALMEA